MMHTGKFNSPQYIIGIIQVGITPIPTDRQQSLMGLVYFEGAILKVLHYVIKNVI
jgi:hypothetical protein